ncbi:MAG: 2-oxoacid:acceptor oxidoreductase subunit alpha [Methanoregula sp.]|nr:2-oxoacid:acceptor oxidoreductase subunit alpha [Methanoregula sp.]
MAGNEVSVLLGGRAGDGINSAGAVIAQFLNHLGYFPYLYFDYPSLIRGGHNFAIIRSAGHPVGVHGDMVDFVLALNQETVTRHHARFHARTVMVYNADVVRADGQGVPVKTILMEEKAPPIMGNSAVIGAFAKAAGIAWDTVNTVFLAHMPKGADLNLRVARRAYDQCSTVLPIPPLGDRRLSLISGNEAIGLGMVAGGLSAYVSYPMTPSSSLLHFLAENAGRFGITVIHPENEIAVMLMALGLSYGGQQAAVGTSGGGFCLMTEGLSLAGMAEIPIVLVVSQRTGPSTGLPTYTAQSDLHFVLNAGQGEFPRFVVAPGDAQEAYFWSAVAMNIAWKFQVPAFILADKTLSEGVYGVDPSKIPDAGIGEPLSRDGTGHYRRYADTANGISPLAFPGTKGAVVKVNSYAHDESGITIEDAGSVIQMSNKRARKAAGLAKEMESYTTVRTGGIPGAATAIVCWGSTKGVCCEVAEELGLRTLQPVVMSPFPDVQCAVALKGVRRLIAVEENATGQLASLLRLHGISPDAMVLQYDGRPFTPNTLLSRIREVIA